MLCLSMLSSQPTFSPLSPLPLKNLLSAPTTKNSHEFPLHQQFHIAIIHGKWQSQMLITLAIPTKNNPSHPMRSFSQKPLLSTTYGYQVNPLHHHFHLTIAHGNCKYPLPHQFLLSINPSYPCPNCLIHPNSLPHPQWLHYISISN